MQRILEVRSDPPGADVWIHGEHVGVTPLDHEFSTYGTIGVVVRRDGFSSAKVVKSLQIPWYEHFPLDFFVENVLPIPIRDVHRVDVSLDAIPERMTSHDLDDLAQAADRARRRAQKVARQVDDELKPEASADDS